MYFEENRRNKNPDIIPIKSKISDNCLINSNRPLMSKTKDKFEPTFHTLPNSSQYDIKYRMPQTYQHTLTPMANVGANVCWQPCDNVYEDWLRYKNALPLDTSDLLPLEQLRPPEEYLPPPLVYSDTLRNTSVSQLQDCDMYASMSRDLRVSPVLVSAQNNSAYYTRQSDYVRNNSISPKRLAKETKTVVNKKIDTSLGSTELKE